MLTDAVIAFVRASLAPPPARLLEIGAGNGDLAAHLRTAGYDVRAIDPAAPQDSGVESASLLEVEGTFDAAIAVLSLHHVEPLADSVAHLAARLGPGARLVIDEFNVARLDERAAGWWLTQRAALGGDEHHDAPGLIEMMRHHVHALETVREALLPHFMLGEPVPCAYLHRWNLDARLHGIEEHLIAAGSLPAVGARMIAVRRPS